MSPSTDEVGVRKPVWIAFSELFLDTRLDDEDYCRIAETLARSPYSERELWDILRFEVYPSCRSNLHGVAGEWAGFNEEWLVERIAPRCGKRPRIGWFLLQKWMIWPYWSRIRHIVRDIRKRRGASGPAAGRNTE